MNQSTRQRRVLVVDQDLDAAENLSSMLAMNGFAARFARDLTQCVQQVANFLPDVVLVEANKLCGAAPHAPDTLRENHKKIHIVAMTSSRDHRSLYQLAQAGFDEMIDPQSGLDQIIFYCQ